MALKGGRNFTVALLCCMRVCVKSLSHVQFCCSPWAVAHQAPLYMGFSSQEDWSGLPCPSPGDLPDPGMEPLSLASTCISRKVPGKPVGNQSPQPDLQDLQDQVQEDQGVS